MNLKQKLCKKLKKSGGFTLIEMLIVVAIIAILVAVSIPMVNSSMNKAKKATDDANERAAKAAAIAEFLLADPIPTNPTPYYYNAATGKAQNDATDIDDYGQDTTKDGVTRSGYVIVTVNPDGTATVAWSDS